MNKSAIIIVFIFFVLIASIFLFASYKDKPHFKPEDCEIYKNSGKIPTWDKDSEGHLLIKLEQIPWELCGYCKVDC